MGGGGSGVGSQGMGGDPPPMLLAFPGQTKHVGFQSSILGQKYATFRPKFVPEIYRMQLLALDIVVCVAKRALETSTTNLIIDTGSLQRNRWCRVDRLEVRVGTMCIACTLLFSLLVVSRWRLQALVVLTLLVVYHNQAVKWGLLAGGLNWLRS